MFTDIFFQIIACFRIKSGIFQLIRFQHDLLLKQRFQYDGTCTCFCQSLIFAGTVGQSRTTDNDWVSERKPCESSFKSVIIISFKVVGLINSFFLRISCFLPVPECFLRRLLRDSHVTYPSTIHGKYLNRQTSLLLFPERAYYKTKIPSQFVQYHRCCGHSHQSADAYARQFFPFAGMQHILAFFRG